ncbi:MAG: PDZ domain-containing protein [Planctomycetes bacterium]|nr:PDZ domain-containing protein [Planctomycetota bacterium]
MRGFACMLGFVSLVGLPFAVQAQGGSGAPPDFDRLVKELGSPDFQTREAATTKLRDAGEAARTALQKAAGSEHLEQRARVRRLLDQLGETGLGDDPVRARDRLRGRPLEPGRPRVEVRRQRGARSMPRLEDYGGRLDDYMDALSEFLDEMTRSPRSQHEALDRWVRGGSFSISLVGPGQTTRVMRNGESISFTRDATGKVTLEVGRVDQRTGKVEAVGTYSGKDLEAFKEAHGEIYDRYRDTGVFDSSRHGFVTEWPLPRAPVRPPTVRAQSQAGTDAVHGATIAPVPAVLRSHLNLPRQAVLITAVKSGSPADGMGLRSHDVLTHMDGVPVASGADVRAVLASSTRETITLRLLRKGREMKLEGVRPERR